MSAVPLLAQHFTDLSDIKEHGEGGQKLVFSAIHKTDGLVVLKLIKPGLDTHRTDREIAAVTDIACPRVPKVFASGKIPTPLGQLTWIREQRVAGQSLRHLLGKGLRLDLAQATGLITQVLEALIIAEQRRIVHRDIKPDNIMMDENGDFWLLDFGLARHMDLESLTASGTMGVGTLGYAPPEQYNNKKREIDIRADIFGLGITAYEMIHGINPFREGATSVHEVFRRIENIPLPKVFITGDHNGELATLLNYMCQRRREHRPRTAASALAIAGNLMNQRSKT